MFSVVSVFLSVCPSVQALTFELLHTDFILGIAGTSLPYLGQV